MTVPRLAFALLAATLPLAGCIGLGGDDEPLGEEALSINGTPAVLNEAGELVPADPLLALTADTVLDAPVPPPEGRWYEYAWTEDPWTVMPSSWTTVVARSSGSTFTLLADDERLAVADAMWQWFFLGDHDAATLTKPTANFHYLAFPLTDGATWEMNWGLEEGGVAAVAVATFREGIDTGNGVFPGYEIVVRPTDWRLEILFEYAPAAGFLTSGGMRDPDTGTWAWRWQVTDWGDDFGGTLYEASSTPLVTAYHEIDVDPEDPTVEPAPRHSFDVPEGLTYLYIQAGAYAYQGLATTELIDPDRTHHSFQASGAEHSVNEVGDFFTPLAGTWEVVMGGVAADQENWVHAWGATVSEVQIG